MDTGDTAAERQKLQRLEELLWVAQAQAGDSDAFGRLMNRYEKRLLYYLRRIVPDGESALDLHQEVWMDAFRGLSLLQVPEAFCVWIYRIAHRKALRFIRAEARSEATSAFIAERASQDKEFPDEGSLDAEVIHHALQRLPPEDREVLVLYYFRDLSIRELAAVLDCPAGTVKSRLYHARVALRRIIEKKQL